MKSQSLVLLAVAGVCGLIAMFGVKQALNKPSAPTEEMVTALQATVDIGPGQPLDETNTKSVQVNINACPKGIIRDLTETADRSVMVPIAPGDWILTGKLSEKGEHGAASTIPDGMRAVTIPVDATQTHSGMLRPGNRVDIMLTYKVRCVLNGTESQRTKTILQYVEVFAVDNQMYGANGGPEGAGAKNISVLVKPEQGNLLRLAESLGKLSTSLRSNGDKAELEIVEVADDVLGMQASPNNVDAASVLGLREQLNSRPAQSKPAGGEITLFEDLPEGELPPASVADQLRKELEGKHDNTPAPEASAPVIQVAEAAPRNVWTMEIREGGSNKVRLESVELPEDSGAGSIWDFFKSKRKP